jgi:glutamate--cysteine ligase
VLVHEDDLAPAAIAAAAPARDLWTEAARDALQHPVLADAAKRCFELALDAMPTAGVDAATIDATADYVDRFVSRGLTPADERLDEWARTGVMLPRPENATPESVWT